MPFGGAGGQICNGAGTGPGRRPLFRAALLRRTDFPYSNGEWIARNRWSAAGAVLAIILLIFSYGREVVARRLAETRLEAVRGVALRLARMQDVIDHESTLGAKKRAVEEAMGLCSNCANGLGRTRAIVRSRGGL